MHDIRCLYIKQELRVFSVLSLFANTKLRLEESSILFLLEEGVIMIISVLESFRKNFESLWDQHEIKSKSIKNRKNVKQFFSFAASVFNKIMANQVKWSWH